MSKVSLLTATEKKYSGLFDCTSLVHDLGSHVQGQGDSKGQRSNFGSMITHRVRYQVFKGTSGPL